jgi:hypothetical protein
LPRHFVTQVSYQRVAEEQLQRKLVNLGAASHVVLGRINVATRVQAHVHAAHDLACAAGRVVFFQYLQLELHVPLKACWRTHRVTSRI